MSLSRPCRHERHKPSGQKTTQRVTRPAHFTTAHSMRRAHRAILRAVRVMVTVAAQPHLRTATTATASRLAVTVRSRITLDGPLSAGRIPSLSFAKPLVEGDSVDWSIPADTWSTRRRNL